MSGIGDYFHGESGVVTARAWVADSEGLTYTISLTGDPHRDIALDYGSDIGIDPALRPGDEAVYLRVNWPTGIWVKPGDEFDPGLKRAFERVGQNRKRLDDYGERAEDPRFNRDAWLETLARESGVPARLDTLAARPPERPGTPITVFLAHSSKNALLARQFYDYLREDAKAAPWFSPAHPGEAPNRDEEIMEWLRGAVHDCRVFLALLSADAASSVWVQREISYATGRTADHPDFHLVALKLDETPVAPAMLHSPNLKVIDCDGLSLGEILEELYAAVYRRQGRRDWLMERYRRGGPAPDFSHGYDRLRSDGGKAVRLKWSKNDSGLRWSLDYRRDGELRHVEGRGANEIVDLGIQPDDLVGCFQYQQHRTLWMRSAGLELTPDAVADTYQQKLRAPTVLVRVVNVLMALLGLGVIGLAEAGFLYYVRTYLAGRPLELLDPAVFPLFLSWVRIAGASAIFVSGLYAWINYSHPLQFEERPALEALKYSGRALYCIAVAAVAHPIVWGLITLFVGGIPLAMVLGVLQWISGGDWSRTVFPFGLLALYGVGVIYGCYRFWQLWREGVEYCSEPEAWWI